MDFKKLIIVFLVIIIKEDFAAYSQTLNSIAVQELNFGYFTNVGVGTITVGSNGGIMVTGGVSSIGNDSQPAIFQVSINATQTINIAFPGIAILTRSGGNETMTLSLGPTDKGSSFLSIPSPGINIVKVGATLSVANNSVNPPGRYSGQVYIEFTIAYE